MVSTWLLFSHQQKHNQGKETLLEKNYTQNLDKVIKIIDEAKIKDHLGEMVRGTVEETLNEMLDAEADKFCNAERYQRTRYRTDTRAGCYQRKLHTKAGEVQLNVPKLRQQKFETAVIERYKRRESSVEEAMIEVYLGDVSVRRVEDGCSCNMMLFHCKYN